MGEQFDTDKGGRLMVWGLNMPSGFGNYLPDGDFAGYGDRLKKYFVEEMPEEQKAKFGDGAGSKYRYHVSQKFTEEPGSVLGDGIPVGQISEHEWPNKFELHKSYAALGSLFQMPNRLLAVETAFKDVVERVEPGIHQFRPLSVTTRIGKVFPKQYYTLVIGQFLDSFDPIASDEGTWEKAKNSDSYLVYINSKKYIAGLAFSRSAIGGAQLWRERKLYSPEIYFSDTLKAELEKAGLRLPQHFQMKEL
ncbi:MAG: hypothetical protein K5905_30115 [Roseibium sp.]|uniref:imm11 family protein n=1 Tax=Roseibium sp. TaxID=1936156 RepID=UPI00260207DC|nr:DUF1629 domain-containing protein [Roseibium sp.]MCV0429715.1 hypothetical protein [Roseibium sp.]